MAATESTIRLIFDGVSKGVIAAAAATRAAVKSIGDESDRTSKQVEKLDKAFSPILSIAAKGAGFAALGALIGGVAGQALVAAPAVIGFGASFAVVKLGMDGVKKAAEQLKPSVDSLKKALSDNFAQKLTPVFAQLKETIAGIQGPLVGMSTAISRMVAQLVGVVSSEDGIRRLGAAIGSFSALIDASGPGLAVLVEGLLALAERVAPAMRDLGKAIGHVFDEIGFALGNISADTAIRAMDGLSAALRGIGNVVGPLITLLADLGAALGDSVGVVLENLGQAISDMSPGFTELGKAVGDILRAAAPLLPVIGKLANDGFRALAAALEKAVPLVQDFARWATDNPDAVKTIALAVLGLAVSFKTLKTALAIKAAVDGAIAALKFLIPAAGVEGAAAGTAWGRGFLVGAGKLLKGAAIAAAVLAAADALDKFNVSAAGGPENLRGFEDALHNTLGALKELATGILSGDLSGIFTDIGDEWDTLVQKFQTGESPIGAVWQSISTGASGFLAMLSALPGQVGTALSGLGSSISSMASGAWSSLVTAAQSAVNSVVTFVTGLPGAVSSALSSLGGSISAAASGAWGSLVTATQSAIDSVVGFATDLPFKIGFALGSLVGIIASTAVTAWNGLVSATSTAVNSTVTFASGLPGRISSALSSLGSTLVGIASSAWSSFTSAVVTGATATVTFVRGIPGQISSALSALAGLITGVATTAWNSFRNAVVTGANSVVAFVRGVPGQISSALSSLVGLLTTAGSTAINGLRNGISSGVGAVIAFVRGIPGQIVGALGNLGGLLVGAGRSVMEGLLSGIRAAVQAVYSFVSGIAAGIAARKGPLDVDRKVLVPAGLALMAGLRSGMETGLAQVLGLASGASGQIAGAVGGSSLALSAPNPNAGVLQQLLSLQSSAAPIQVTVLLDGQPVRDIARTEVATSNRATRRTVGMGAGTTF